MTERGAIAVAGLDGSGVTAPARVPLITSDRIRPTAAIFVLWNSASACSILNLILTLSGVSVIPPRLTSISKLTFRDLQNLIACPDQDHDVYCLSWRCQSVKGGREGPPITVMGSMESLDWDNMLRWPPS